MSTITTLNSTDSGSISRGVINTNFTNLNTDKIESADVRILANKKLSDSTTTVVANADVTKGIQWLIFGTTGIIGFFATAFTTAKTITFPDVTGTVLTSATSSITSAVLSGALSDETGSGSVVFSTNPTIVKPVLNATNPTAQTYTPSASGTATLDLSLANQHYITMPAGNITVALTNDTNNQIFYVSVTQDGVGSRTVTWFTTIKWAGGSAPVLTTTASKRDTFIFVRTGSGTYDGFVVGQSI